MEQNMCLSPKTRLMMRRLNGHTVQYNQLEKQINIVIKVSAIQCLNFCKTSSNSVASKQASEIRTSNMQEPAYIICTGKFK
jgi:hypothetical protein